MRRRTPLPAVLALAIAIASVAGCAQRGIPPGGPVDDTAPQIAEHLPREGETGVPADAPIRLTFSEGMNRGSVERALRVFPEPGPLRFEWRETELTVLLDPGAPVGDSGERILTLLTEAQDRRGNRIEEPFENAWSAGETLPRGSISGIVKGISGRIPPRVLLFRSPGPPVDSIAAVPPLRETSPDPKGAFRFSWLPTGDGPLYALVAIRQERIRAEIDLERDLIALGPDSLPLPPARSDTSGLELTLVKSDAPGAVLGALPEPGAGWRFFLVADTDTTLIFEADPDSTGRFTLETVPPGRYRVEVVRETGESEAPPYEGPAWIRVRPGEKVVLPGGAPPDTLSAPPAAADTSSAPPDTTERRENR